MLHAAPLKKLDRICIMVNRFSPISLGDYLKTVGTDRFVLTETSHLPNRVLLQHCHERTNLAFVLWGSFTESIDRKYLECGSRSLLIKPAGEPHSNQYGPKGARCLVIEVLPRWIEMLCPRSKALNEVEHIQGGMPSVL